MERKTLMGALIICVVLFIAAAVISGVVAQDETAVQGTGSGHVVLNEILASNRTYPAPNGLYLDFIEVRNLSGTPTDISGYMLSDDMDSIGYTFPSGTVLEPYGYALCWCYKEAESSDFASFGISKDGNDVIFLYNSANVQVDRKEVPRMDINVPLVRQENGTWETAALATPGYENSEDGYAAWLRSMGGDKTQVVISEVMTGNYCTAINSGFQVCDWIELTNTGSNAAVLDGAYLSDDPLDPLKWQIPALTINPGESAVIPCVATGAGENEADFALSAGGCTVILSGKLGNTLSRVEIPSMEKGLSWSLEPDGAYRETDRPTPGFSNDDRGYAAWLAEVGAQDAQIVISEIMTRNRSTVLSAGGTLCDWVEIVNNGETTVDLSGTFLSDDPYDLTKHQIDNLILSPGQHAVIPCAGSFAGENEAAFSLNGGNCTVILTGAAGNVLSRVDCPTLGEDRVWALQSDGTYAQTHLATPGSENTEEAALSYRGSQVPLGALAISEVMPSNDRYYRQNDGKYYDWVELVNVSDRSIDLSDYFLSDDSADLQKFRLPQRTLEPGQRVTVICVGTAELTGSQILAPFTLSREESWLYVSTAEGFSDYIRIYDVPYQGSVGRVEDESGIWYFTTPTPGSQNGTGVGSVSPTPAAVTAEGVYNGVESVSVELSGEGEIYYTLDGSFPTKNDRRYTDPLTLTSTTVVRFASFCDGKLPSDVVTASYIINENHTMPVVSIAVEPSEFSGENGIYKNYTEDREIRGSFSVFEEGGSVTLDCGVKMYGHTALQLPKKNLKVNFRGKYGADVLSYPVFGEDGPEIFDSLCLRAGQDNPQAIIRDELFASLCADMSDAVLVQKSRYCIVYVNGSYYGIYAMKEAFGETYYAQNKGVSEASVTVHQAPVGYSSEMFDLLNFCASKDMTDPDNYAYLAQRIDMDSLCDWMIIQGYSANADIQQNLRYFRSTENGNKWQYALYDLDWAFYTRIPYGNMLSDSVWQHKMITKNIVKNPEFREKFMKRLSEALATTLSTENVVSRINELEEILDPEVKRDRMRWGYSYSGWKKEIQRMRNFIENVDYEGLIVQRISGFLNMSGREVEQYFGRWT